MKKSTLSFFKLFGLHPVTHAETLDAMAAWLAEIMPPSVRVTWKFDPHAGCSCSCSPGIRFFVVASDRSRGEVHAKTLPARAMLGYPYVKRDAFVEVQQPTTLEVLAPTMNARLEQFAMLAAGAA